jgi:hypothetical protein
MNMACVFFNLKMLNSVMASRLTVGLKSALISLCLVSCAQWKTVEHIPASDPFERVQAIFPVSVETIREALIGQERIPHHSPDALPTFPDLRVFFVAAAGDDQGIFPDDGGVRVQLDRSPWLQDYLNLPRSTRRNDLYLYSVMDLFWPSEYQYQGRPAKFYSDFLLHLSEISDSETTVEVFEFLPRVWVGESFQLGAHGPCMCWDQRWVQQTKQDRIALLSAIRLALERAPDSTY